MRSQLYLVRRELRKFVGPMSLADFKTGLQKMQFGLQDEVSGHCGPWVEMENVEILQKFYPEVAHLISEDNEKSWKVSNQELNGGSPVKGERASKAPKKNPSPGRPARPKRSSHAEPRKSQEKPSYRNAWVFLGFSLLALAFAILLATNEISLIRVKEEGLPNLSDLQPLVFKEDPGDFVTFLGPKLPSLISKTARSKDLQGQWLPYLRYYAFATTGAVDGLNVKILRGNTGASAPNECTVEGWRKRLHENFPGTLSWLTQGRMTRTPWTKLLSWDPFWVRRRQPKGWIKPRNFYEGCLSTAWQALRTAPLDAATFGVETPPNGETINSIGRRLEWQLDIIHNGTAPAPEAGASPGVVGALSCLESADQLAALSKCRNFYAGFDTAAVAWLDERFGLHLVRLAAKVKGTPDPTLTTELQNAAAHMPLEDSFDKLELQPEMRFLQMISTIGVPTAIERVEAEFPDFRLK